MEDLISVIMSVYNESIDEIQKSVNSILNQSYSNIEFIIVIDNPDNTKLEKYLYSLNDPRIRIIKNEKNIGLVKSLNKAIALAKGNYLARMDADDISAVDRLKYQKDFLDKKKLDLVGGNIDLIDENDNLISKNHFPSQQFWIQIFLKWGNCIPHPTWLLRKEVYRTLNGYREVPRCEDYDFVCRTLQQNFKIGNVDKFILKYRIRSNSISNSNRSAQYILRRFISKRKNSCISEQEIDIYLNSDIFSNDIKEYENFIKLKTEIKKHPTIKNFIRLCVNRNTYVLGIEKISLKLRNLV